MALAPRAPKGGAPIERGITAFARGSNGGLIVLGTPLAAPHRELIYALAARHRLPTVYSLRFYVTAGGLISYGPDTSVRLTLEESQLVSIIGGLGSRLILRKSL